MNNIHLPFSARRYCLSIGATLPIYHDQQTRDYLVALKSRLGFVYFYLGLRLQSHTRRYYEWSDGSPAVFVKWRESEPSGGSEACANEVGDGLNDVPCSYPFKIICQQPVQGKYTSQYQYILQILVYLSCRGLPP